MYVAHFSTHADSFLASTYLRMNRAYFLVVIFSVWVVYIIFLQFRYPSATKKQTRQAEIAKSGLVTLLWIWLLIYAILYSIQIESAILGFIIIW